MHCHTLTDLSFLCLRSRLKGSRLFPQVKLLQPKRQLKPRTFRAAEGQTVLIGGVARIDVVRSPGATLYLTVWASSDLTCHFGKTEGADDRSVHASCLDSVMPGPAVCWRQ